MKMVSLKLPCNQITKSLLCPQHTQYNGKLYRCTSQRRDGDTSVIWIVDKGFFVIVKYKNSKVTNDKSERKRYCNGRKQGLRFILSLVQVLSTIITYLDHITTPQHATKSHSKATNSGEQTKRLW